MKIKSVNLLAARGAKSFELKETRQNIGRNHDFLAVPAWINE